MGEDFKRYLKNPKQAMKEDWYTMTTEQKVCFIIVWSVIFLTIVWASVHIIKYNQDKKELLDNHNYCYAFVFRDGYIGNGHHRIFITYEIDKTSFEKVLYPNAHVGDSILIMYNPNKPSFCLPVEYNKNKYVTKQMVDFHMYHIDKRKIH